MISEGRRAPDLGMPTQAGNNLLYNLTRKAKSEKELLGMIDKLSKKLGGKYKDAKDELITRAAVDAFNTRGNKGEQGTADRNVYVQLKGASDFAGGGTIKLDDKSNVKVSKKEAETIVRVMDRLKPADRLKAQKGMQKDKKTFMRFLKVLGR